MRNFWLILSVLWLWTCSGGDKATGPEEAPIIINLTSLGGQAQKGPFNNGTAINIAELTNTLSPTGRNFSSAITDNTGRFAVANVQLESPYVELRANGYYFNEVTNEISSGQLTLFALSDLTGKTSLNVNILTHLEKNRIVTLMSGDNPKTFAQAKLQAQEEVLAIFDYSRANVPESELLDISQDGAANAKLLAISAIIQGNLNAGQMSELLANISTDIASDGILDDTNLRNTLIENSKNLDMAEVRSNLEARYVSLGITATIPDFESEINQFLKPPVANDMSASTGEDTPINITLAGSDPEGESLTFTIVEVNNATVTLNGNVATYTPNANFFGTDTFTYYANDGTSDSNIATVTMTVSGEDDDPNTQNAAATTDEDVAVVLQLTAEEYDGDSYSFGIISQPSNGSVSLDGANATYTPNQDYNGTDSFTFEATDDTGRMMNVGTATITINPVNDAPVLTTTTVSVSVDEEQSVSFTIDATDIDGDQLTFIATNQDAQNQPIVIDGTVDTNGNTYIYTPYSNGSYELSEGVSREDFFYYYAQDSSGEKTQYGSAYINVTGVDDLPHADDKTLILAENSSANLTLSATDPDGGDNSSIQYEITQDVSNGSISFVSTDVISYTPNQDFNGNDQFKYRVVGDMSEGIVDITINDVIGIVKVFNDVQEGYSEAFSDISYDHSSGGYLVSGLSRERGDDGGSTFSMISLKTDSSLEAITYTNNLINFDKFNFGWPQWGDGTTFAPGYFMSKNSSNGEFVAFYDTGLWIVNENTVVGNHSADHPPSQTWSFDNQDYPYAREITGMIQGDDGYIAALSMWNQKDISSSCGYVNEIYPAIAKSDLQGNFLYYLPIDYESDDTKNMIFYGGNLIKGESEDIYYILGASERCSFSNSYQLLLLKFYDNGTSFEHLGTYNLSEQSNSPVRFYGSRYHVADSHSISSNNIKFSALTDLGLATWDLDISSNTITYQGTSGDFGFPSSSQFELLGGANEFYIAESTGSDINVSKYDGSSGARIWKKEIDVMASGYEDVIGGMTLNDNGVAISGSFRESVNDDWNGFILLLDSNGD